MRRFLSFASLAGIAIVLALSLAYAPGALSEEEQQAPERQSIEKVRAQERLQQVVRNKAAYVAGIVRRWDDAARESGRWGSDYRAELAATMMKLRPESLVIAGEASSFDELMEVVAIGDRLETITGQSRDRIKDLQSVPPIVRAFRPDSAPPPVAALGDTDKDFVYTPVPPCRIVDSRLAMGRLTGFVPRTYDADNAASFASQGGVAAPCGIPFNSAKAVAMTVSVVEPVVDGWVSAWGMGAWTETAVIAFRPGDTISNTTIVPIVPGAGADFSVMSSTLTHVVIDINGYFAPPVATALSCTDVGSGLTSVPINTWTNLDPTCPTGYTATGGGWNTSDNDNIWVQSYALGNGWRIRVNNQSGLARNIEGWVRCCRVPGR